MGDEEEEFNEKKFLFYQGSSEHPHPPEHEGLSEKQFAIETLERYSGCPADLFRSCLLLTNFPNYVSCFAEMKNVKVYEGSMFKVAHSEADDVSIVDFKIGSPAAALVVDLCSFLPLKANLLLGMCGGLRRRYQIGDYLLPVASIRDEGTSEYYFPAEVPALSNFLVTRAATEIMEEGEIPYHIGITYTTNKRFWEFNEEFKAKLKSSRAQAIEMECATLFTASYSRKLTLGALLLVSDLPLNPKGIKTKESSQFVYQKYMRRHIEVGISVIKRARDMLNRRIKGVLNRDMYQ